ncbi:MAG: Rieske 2Fe-2S domain-containing protein [Bacteroidota bacterium]
MRRRIFIETLGKATVATGLGVLAACSEDDPEIAAGSEIEIDLSEPPFDQLQEVDRWVLHPEFNVILVNDTGTIRAYTSVCTHSQCSRNWVFGTTEATCTCHGSKFNQQGQVLQGPARGDLRSFTVETPTADSLLVRT